MSSLNKAGTGTLLAVASLTIMVGSVVIPGLPTVVQGLQFALDPGWLVTLPALGVVLFGPMAGWLIGRLGARSTLCIGLFCYGLLGAGGMLLHGNMVVAIDRLLLGGATALLMASGTTLLAEFHHGQARMRMIARQTIAIELGGVVFLALGGVLAGLNWRLPFVLYLAAWLLLVASLRTIPKPAPATPPALHTPAHGKTLMALVGIYAMALMAMLSFFCAIISLPLHLRGLGYSEAGTGYFLSFVSLSAMAAAALLPRLSRRCGEKNVAILAFAAFAAAHLMFTSSVALPALLVAGLLLGSGFGCSVPLLSHMTVERSPPERRGQALGLLSAALFLGQFLSSFVSSASGTAVFTTTAVLALASGLYCLLFARRHAAR